MAKTYLTRCSLQVVLTTSITCCTKCTRQVWLKLATSNPLPEPSTDSSFKTESVRSGAALTSSQPNSLVRISRSLSGGWSRRTVRLCSRRPLGIASKMAERQAGGQEVSVERIRKTVWRVLRQAVVSVQLIQTWLRSLSSLVSHWQVLVWEECRWITTFPSWVMSVVDTGKRVGNIVNRCSMDWRKIVFVPW